jgi:hypothetical protein
MVSLTVNVEYSSVDVQADENFHTNMVSVLEDCEILNMHSMARLLYLKILN